jgi:hypothetical protein
MVAPGGVLVDEIRIGGARGCPAKAANAGERVQEYREKLLGASYKAAALMEAEGSNICGTQGTGDNEVRGLLAPRL